MPDMGLRVLVIEDNAALGRFIAAALDGAGMTVLGPAREMSAALAAVGGVPFDVAVLDRTLHGEDALAIADAVIERGCGCVLISGHPLSSLPARFRQLPFLEKPFAMGALVAAVEAAAKAVRRSGP